MNHWISVCISIDCMSGIVCVCEIVSLLQLVTGKTTDLHVLHVVKDVLLVLLGGGPRKIFSHSFLPELSEVTSSLSLRSCSGVETFIVVMVLYEVRFAVTETWKLMRLWGRRWRCLEGHHVDVVVSGRNEWTSTLRD